MFFQEVTKKVDKGRTVDIIYIDFSKMFDKLQCGKMLWKVRLHVIQGELVNWIEIWLCRRKQGMMIVEGCFSHWRLVTSGEP